MQAYRAQELSAGSMKNKGPWFKLRLYWFCGILNKKIEKEAEHTNYTAKITVKDKSIAKQYFKVMAPLYEKLGYIVYYNIERCRSHIKSYEFVVCWDLEKHLKSLPLHKSEFYRDYDYYTDCPETKKEKVKKKEEVKKNEMTPVETSFLQKKRSGLSNEEILEIKQMIEELDEREKERQEAKLKQRSEQINGQILELEKMVSDIIKTNKQ